MQKIVSIAITILLIFSKTINVDAEYAVKTEEKHLLENVMMFDRTASVSTEELVITEDKHLLASVMLAEARGESELGQRLVVDCILNRLDSGYYGDTIEEVVMAKNQFESVSNGSYKEMEVKASDIEIVLEEIDERTDVEIMHFRTKQYHTFGTPMYVVGNHYFSK